MTEAKDLISLLVTIDLGVMAASLTLLALYPAIASVSQRSGIKAVLGSETNRRLLFSWLGRTAIFSGVALLALLVQAASGVLLVSHPANSGTVTLSIYEQSLLWSGTVLTAVSILTGARAGRLIFTMTSDAS